MPAWHDAVFNSELMQREMPYRVLLPSGFKSSGSRYPVLYLLHGLFGSFENWTTLTRIESHPSRHQLIIVTPEGENGWYTDGSDANDRYESCFIQELVPAIDEQYLTLAHARGRAVAGLSMGGYGAFKFALKFPQMFAFAASVSGAFNVTHWSDESPTLEWDLFGPLINRIFGPADSNIRAANDFYKLVGALSETGIADLPYLYFDCGIGDGFIGANRHLANLLKERGIKHDFRELPGGHDWEYWAYRGPHLIDLAVERLSKPVCPEIGFTN